jgi:hypothetical protein
MSEETPFEVDRRQSQAAFILGQIRAGYTPWGEPGDPDDDLPEGEDEPEQGTVAADYFPGGRHNP